MKTSSSARLVDEGRGDASSVPANIIMHRREGDRSTPRTPQGGDEGEKEKVKQGGDDEVDGGNQATDVDGRTSIEKDFKEKSDEVEDAPNSRTPRHSSPISNTETSDEVSSTTSTSTSSGESEIISSGGEQRNGVLKDEEEYEEEITLRDEEDDDDDDGGRDDVDDADKLVDDEGVRPGETEDGEEAESSDGSKTARRSKGGVVREHRALSGIMNAVQLAAIPEDEPIQTSPVKKQGITDLLNTTGM